MVVLYKSLPLDVIEAKNKERMILGIDPGTVNMGYGLVIEVNKKLKLEALGVINLSSFQTHPDKLKRIFERTIGLIDQYHPDCIALEDPFYGKNVQVMLKLGRAQGVAMAAALSRDIPIFEYSPKKIKQSITGRGNASKEQVAAMLRQLLVFDHKNELLDATDGLAVAVCHAFQGFSSGVSKKYTGWESFVKDNPKKMA
jgi:crossover junction endodeoxyribonuclease RuvC